MEPGVSAVCCPIPVVSKFLDHWNEARNPNPELNLRSILNCNALYQPSPALLI